MDEHEWLAKQFTHVSAKHCGAPRYKRYKCYKKVEKRLGYKLLYPAYQHWVYLNKEKHYFSSTL